MPDHPLADTSAPPACRVLVTGATGFVGRRLVEHLVERWGASSVACLSAPPSTAGERQALAAQRARGLQIFEMDLCGKPDTFGDVPKVGLVFHLAARSDTSASEAMLRVNDIGTRHLLQWLRGRLPTPVRVVYVSSIAVHDRRRAPMHPVREDSPLNPRTSYGLTKLRGEHAVRDEWIGAGASWTIMRLPTVYGPGQKRGGLFDTLEALASRRALTARVNWPGRTSVVHVDDLVDVLIAMATSPAAAGEVYCVAGDETPRVGEIAREMAAALGTTAPPIDLGEPVWDAVRAIVWHRGIQGVGRFVLPQTLWRLSLIVSDAFVFDTGKFRRAYAAPLRTVRQGLAGIGHRRPLASSATEANDWAD